MPNRKLRLFKPGHHSTAKPSCIYGLVPALPCSVTAAMWLNKRPSITAPVFAEPAINARIVAKALCVWKMIARLE